MLALYLATGIVGGAGGVAVPVLDLARVKQHLRVRHTDEDDLISGYLAAAIAHVEKATSRLLTRREITQDMLRLENRIDLWWGPDPVFVNGQGLAYFDSAGVPTVLSGLRLVRSSVFPPVAGWPTLMDYSPLSLTYTAGYEEVPADLMHAVLLLAGHWYECREAVSVGESVSEVPFAVAALVQPYRKAFV